MFMSTSLKTLTSILMTFRIPSHLHYGGAKLLRPIWTRRRRTKLPFCFWTSNIILSASWWTRSPRNFGHDTSCNSERKDIFFLFHFLSVPTVAGRRCFDFANTRLKLWFCALIFEQIRRRIGNADTSASLPSPRHIRSSRRPRCDSEQLGVPAR